MRTCLATLIFLSCLGVNAGRESHGLLPAPLQCQKSLADKARLSAMFSFTDNEITSVLLTTAGQIQPEISCIDSYSTNTLQASSMQVTVVCASTPNSQYIVELHENLTEAEARVWSVEPDHSTRLLDTLPCD